MHGVGRIGLICRAVIEGIIHWNIYRIIKMMRALTVRPVSALLAYISRIFEVLILAGETHVLRKDENYDKISGL